MLRNVCLLLATVIGTFAITLGIFSATGLSYSKGSMYLVAIAVYLSGWAVWVTPKYFRLKAQHSKELGQAEAMTTEDARLHEEGLKLIAEYREMAAGIPDEKRKAGLLKDLDALETASLNKASRLGSVSPRV